MYSGSLDIVIRKDLSIKSEGLAASWALIIKSNGVVVVTTSSYSPYVPEICASSVPKSVKLIPTGKELEVGARLKFICWSEEPIRVVRLIVVPSA